MCDCYPVGVEVALAGFMGCKCTSATPPSYLSLIFLFNRTAASQQANSSQGYNNGIS